MKGRLAFQTMAEPRPHEDRPIAIRPAVVTDAGALMEIYNQGVDDRVGTFQTWHAERSDFADRLREGVREPLLVAIRDMQVLAWAGVIPYSARSFYAGVGEYQIYVARTAQGRGLGTRLLDELVLAAEGRDYWKLIGKLFATNAASIALARRCGFREVGVHLRHGQLDGNWRDVVVVERLLGPAAD